MAFENTATVDTPKTSSPAPAESSKATANAPQGYAAQNAALKPAASAEPPKFDQWKLSPEVQVLFVELAKTEDPKALEALMNALVKTHNVPKATVEAVVASNRGFFSKTWGAIRGGSWHTLSTDATGKATLEFKADGKGIGWDAATWALSGDFKDKSLTYTDKDDGWKAKGGYDDRGYVTVTTGADPKQQTTYHAEGGKDGGGARVTHTNGDTTTTGAADVTMKDGQNTATGTYTATEGDKKSLTASGKALWGTTVGAEGSYATKDGDRGLALNGGVTKTGDTTTATGGVTTTAGKQSTAVTGSLAHSDKQNTASGSVVRKDGDNSTTVDGQVLVGGQTGGRAHYNRTDGKNSTDLKAGAVVSGGQTTIDGAVARTNEGGTTSVGGTAWVGPKTGGQVDTTIDRKDRKFVGSADASRTLTDSSTTTEAGGSLAVTRKAELGADGKPKEGSNDITVKVTARGKRTTETSGDNATNLTLGGSYASGSTTADATYTTEGGTKSGAGYRFHDLQTNFGQAWQLDDKAKEGLKLNLGGHLRLSDIQGEDVIATGDLRGHWTKGEGDGKQDLSFRLFGGQEQLSNVSGLAHQTPEMLGDDKGYAKFGHASGTYTEGTRSYSADATLGATDRTTFGGLGLSAAEKDKWKLGATGAFAQQDGKTSTLLKLTGEFAMSEKLKLDGGASYSFTAGSPQHEKLWAIHAGLGYDVKKDQHLTLKMAVAGDGQQVWYVPEVMYKVDDKFSASALAVLGRNQTNTFGAKITHEKSNLTFFGGYGDPTALANPYAGNAGMTMPGMAGNDVMGRGGPQGAFVGVQWNALPTLKKVMGWK